MKVLKRLLLYGFLIFAGLMVFGLIMATRNRGVSTSEGASATVSKATTATPSADLELLDDAPSNEQYGSAITGRIRNNTSKKYSYAQVTFNLYNKQGEQVGTALANVNGLEPGGVWKFKAAILQGDTSTYKLDKITGF